MSGCFARSELACASISCLVRTLRASEIRPGRRASAAPRAARRARLSNLRIGWTAVPATMSVNSTDRWRAAADDPTAHAPALELAIIARYRRWEASVEEALVEMYLVGVSMCWLERCCATEASREKRQVRRSEHMVTLHRASPRLTHHARPQVFRAERSVERYIAIRGTELHTAKGKSTAVTETVV